MKINMFFLVSTLAFAGLAHAQSGPTSGIIESTDPAKIADIERRAQALGAPAPGPAGMKMPGMHHDMPKHEHMHGHKPGDKHEHMHEHKPGDMHGHKHGHKQGAKHGHKHGHKQGAKHGHNGPAKMDGKGPHGAHPMKDGKGPHGAPMDANHGYPAKDAPAKP
jgi:hypothetical protein